MREHFAVYPWKPAAEIQPSRSLGLGDTARASRDTASSPGDRSVFSFRKRMAPGKRRDDGESVDTCGGMTPGLKCPLHYRQDAADRFRHAWPRKRDAGNARRTRPISRSISINFRIVEGKKEDATRRDTVSLWDLLRWLVHAALDLISRSNTSVAMN